MEKRVYKYPLEVQDRQVITIPKGAKILSLHVQDSTPCIWVLVDANEQQKEKVVLRTFGTGQSLYSNGKNLEFIGTYLLRNDQAVFHVFIEHEL